MIFKVILLGLCICVINIFFRQSQSTFVILLNICYVVLVVLMIIDYSSDTVSNIKSLISLTNSNGKIYICLYKGALICVLTKISSDLCKDSGNTVVSDIIDLVGRITLLIIAFPYIECLVKTATSFII